MAKDEKPKDLMGYEALQQEALRSVVKATLVRVTPPRGLPGEHHFYISFRTDFPGVSIPADLTARYPDDMTIVLQNQFWDLTPGDLGFSVTLQFGGQPKLLTIPYEAITRFYDPSVQYLLQFTPPLAAPRPSSAETASTNAAANPSEGESEGPKIVSLDQFRKK